MTVTFLVQTQFGPYQTGSILKVSSDYAQRLVQQYGSSVTITPRYSGTYWYQDGAILVVTALYVPEPTPTPGIIYVNFQSTVQDPNNPNPQFRVFYSGRTYQFTIVGLTNFTRRNPNVVISYDRNGTRIVPQYQYDDLAYQGALVYARQYGTDVEPGIVYRIQQTNNALNGNIDVSTDLNTNAVPMVRTYNL